jgi:hypothetical protein
MNGHIISTTKPLTQIIRQTATSGASTRDGSAGASSEQRRWEGLIAAGRMDPRNDGFGPLNTHEHATAE